MPASGVSLDVRDVSVCRKGKLILDGVSFEVAPGTLTAIIGPNGAGKTTLMRTLSGTRPEQGQILINGEDLYAAPQYWLQRIGYVPADNVLHEQLGLREALLYVGRLRLPGKPLPEIASRVDNLLDHFGFKSDDARRSQPIRALSSGEKKRANICAELIADPPLLLLDEPTSNLDPDAEVTIMRLLATYAHSSAQTTVLVITHTLNTIDECDAIMFIGNGEKVAHGPTDQVLTQLRARTSLGGTSSPFYRWAHIFADHQTRPENRRSCMVTREPTSRRPNASPHEYQSAPWLSELRCLLSRYIRVRLGDPGGLLLTVLAGLSGVLFFTLPGHAFMNPVDESEAAIALNQARQSTYVVSLVVALIGIITTYTEISKEYRIYEHERLKGLSPSAYFVSKWLWLTLIVGIIAPILLLLFIVLVYRQPFPGFPEPRIGEVVGWWEELTRFQLVGLMSTGSLWLILVTMLLACIASVTLGLFISALAGSGERGYLYLSFVVVFMVLFSGLIRNDKVQDLTDSLSLLSTGRWAYEGIASNISMYCWQDSWHFDEYNSTGHVASVYLALVGLGLAAAFGAILTLRLRDPWASPSQNLFRLLAQEWRLALLGVGILAVLSSYAGFLRIRSYEYHQLNYWNRQEYGGDNSYRYGRINRVTTADPLQYWNGVVSQSWCGK